MKQQADFDRIAFIYDWLSRIVFGQSITKAQHAFLDTIPPESNVLVVGGGSGNFLPALRGRLTTGQIVFVDVSQNMISMARRQLATDERVTFVAGTVQDVAADFRANVVITHFFLDLFNDRELDEVIIETGHRTTGEVTWIACDFVRSPVAWHRFLLFVMYQFFGLTAQLRTRVLPDWRGALIRQNYVETTGTEFYGGFIRSIVFRRHVSGAFT